ncbi:hypothetical protein [Chroococcidiopsis sp. CCNUC1]|nr:hypothetical protein [Chroococcidiopsis sp. CCNUC1]URD52243.1 hypothetical protein M5J74_09665 [Chroococcidiopsis sp. CCNUC1]
MTSDQGPGTSQQSTTTYTLHPFFTHHAPRTTHHAPPITNYQLPLITDN